MDPVFADEVPLPLPLPDNPTPPLDSVAVKIGKAPYACIDLNDYPAPHTHARRLSARRSGPLASRGVVLWRRRVDPALE